MAIATFDHDPIRPWRRFHDDPQVPIRPVAEKIHCVSGLDSILQLCQSRPAGKRYSVAGSHWALSEAAVSDNEFIELNWPGLENVPRHEGLETDADLNDLIDAGLKSYLTLNPPAAPQNLAQDPCLKPSDGGAAPNQHFLFHIRAGTRIYDAYRLLDVGLSNTALATALNAASGTNRFNGPWAFETLGGAGGQTVWGALTTGTHGGDYLQKPVSDSVAAILLVVDGGRLCWIERGATRIGAYLGPVASPSSLQTKYGVPKYGKPIDVITDDGIFNAVLVSPGRFGVVASFVMKVVPQYVLLQHKVHADWSDIKAKLISQKHFFFDSVYFNSSSDQEKYAEKFGSPEAIKNRFLQIAISPSPYGSSNDHRCSVTQRWFRPHKAPGSVDSSSGNLHGRKERGLPGVAGASTPYSPPDTIDGEGSNSGTFLTKACASGDFSAGVAKAMAEEVEKMIADGSIHVAGLTLGALGIGFGVLAAISPAVLCLAASALAALLAGLATSLATGSTLAEAINKFVEGIMDEPLIPDSIKLAAIRTAFKLLFESIEKPGDYAAISYAMMDTHDYTDRSCNKNVRSIEVFFDADKPQTYCSYVDNLLNFEMWQQQERKKFTIGYISLRFVKGSDALIAPSQFANTVVLEIAGLADASGSIDFVAHAEAVARYPYFYRPVFHWGQHNPLTASEVLAALKPGNFFAWQAKGQALLNTPAEREAFSTAFSRQTGLEL